MTSMSDRDTAIRTLIGEASNQGQPGMTAVAFVILNRANWFPTAWWGATVGEVCRKHEQFSCWNGGPDTDRITEMADDAPEYTAASFAWDGASAGRIPDPTLGSTTYKVAGTHASWDVAVSDVTPISIGAHQFWRLDPRGPCLAFLQTTGDTANV